MPKKRKRTRGRGGTMRDPALRGPAPAVDDGWATPVTRAAARPPRTLVADRRLGLEDRALWLVNQARRRYGLRPLLGDERLRASARGYSARMAALDRLAHEDVDGSGPADRMRAAGYPRPGSENLACGQAGADEVVHDWLASPGHRANILHPDFRAIGIGVHLDRRGPWWTQHFGF